MTHITASSVSWRFSLVQSPATHQRPLAALADGTGRCRHIRASWPKAETSTEDSPKSTLTPMIAGSSWLQSATGASSLRAAVVETMESMDNKRRARTMRLHSPPTGATALTDPPILVTGHTQPWALLLSSSFSGQQGGGPHEWLRGQQANNRQTTGKQEKNKHRTNS